MTPRTAALRNALENILTEVDGKADASREPGEEREQPNDYMRIQGEADAALAEVQKLERALSDGVKCWPQVTACGSIDDPCVVLHFPDGAQAVYACTAGGWIARELWSRINERDMPLPEVPHE